MGATTESENDRKAGTQSAPDAGRWLGLASAALLTGFLVTASRPPQHQTAS